MDPSPSRSTKFYEVPENVKTPQRIISEAKSSLVRNQFRQLNTKRPITPQDAQRNLFGDRSVRDPSNRPPSTFSLGSRHFDSDRPVSGPSPSTRLAPLEHKPVPTTPSESIAPKPPADPNRPSKRPGSNTRRQLSHSISVEENEASKAPVSAPRRVNSGSSDRSSETMSDILPRPETRSGRPERPENGFSGEKHNSSVSKSGSAGRREEETPEEALYFNTHIKPIVEEMAMHIKDKDPDRLTVLCDKLYGALKERGWLGKACKRRAVILKTIFKLLDLDNPQLLLKLARIILALRVSGNNLTNVCKLVFKVSKDEQHDSFFLEGSILYLLLELTTITDPTVSPEALVYAVGSLKFLSSNASILRHLVKLNALQSLSKMLKNINKPSSDNGKPNDQVGHILVQLTSLLRNLADASTTRAQYISLGLIKDMCQLMDSFHTDADLMLNISRIFSKLTMNAECCQEVGSHSYHFKSFLHLLKIYQRNEDLVLRVCFILGNLTSKNDDCRVKLFEQHKSLETLLSVFKYYVDLDKKSPANSKQKDQKSLSASDAGASSTVTKTEDVLIKLIRVLANLSINAEIGAIIAANEPCLDFIISLLVSKKINSSEELVLNAVATVNNMSFYNVKNSAILKRQIDIAKALLSLMNVEHMEGLAEATRVFGNLSREKIVRDFLVENKVDEMMVAMLDSGKPEIIFTAVGVLINLMADENKRPNLKKYGGVQKLIEVLRDLGPSDWQLASMVCQTLWNFSGKITSSASCFGDNQYQELADILAEYLEHEFAMDPDHTPDVDESMRSLITEKWEIEFCPVANQLLNRIESNSTNLEPL